MKISEMKVELVDYMGSDLSVVNAARVSFAKESSWDIRLTPDTDFGYEVLSNAFFLKDSDVKLINYLAKHNHWTPFGHAFLSFRIKAPIFVARQLGKHQVGLVWNEVSRRYVDEEPEFYLPDLRARAENVKQGSAEDSLSGKKVYSSETGYITLEDVSRTSTRNGLETYKMLLCNGVAPEVARGFLPQNTMTEWIWSGSLAAFSRVYKLRIDPHTQKETRDIAAKLGELVPAEFKHSWEALTNGN